MQNSLPKRVRNGIHVREMEPWTNTMQEIDLLFVQNQGRSMLRLFGAQKSKVWSSSFTLSSTQTSGLIDYLSTRQSV